MKASRVQRYGNPVSVLERDEIVPPKPGGGQVLLRVASPTVNANDVDGCYGRYNIVEPEPAPHYGRPGADGSGRRGGCRR